MSSIKVGLRLWPYQTAHYRALGSHILDLHTQTCHSTPFVFTPSTSSLKECRNTQELAKSKGSFFLDSVFPIRLGSWDFRYYIALFQAETLIEKIERIFKEVDAHGFEFDRIEPRFKDGGVFVNFKYTPTSFSGTKASDRPCLASDALDHALVEIEEALLEKIAAKGGIPSWLGLTHGKLWRVHGRPWKEDMRRYASRILCVAFEGPDISDERIWEILRPYGRIRDLKSPTPVPTGTLRSTIVTFERTFSATVAHNCVHGVYVPHSAKDPGTLTRLSTVYERPIKPHVVRDWLASHPRIVFPVVLFLVGTLTYTVFDPIRAVAVQAKILDWFDYREFAVTKWLLRNTSKGLTSAGSMDALPGENVGLVMNRTVWKDRQDAESTLRSYLTDYPSTITFIHGPAGSGKTQLLRSVIEKADRRAVEIDCSKIYAGTSDAAMVTSLAEQTGYWPVFTFLNSVNNLIDLASVALIGQKAGFSSSLEAQVTQVLEVVSQGLRHVSSSRRKEAELRLKRAQNEEYEAISQAKQRELIRRGLWHDGRIDCVSGNVFSELGVGLEPFGEKDKDAGPEERKEDAEILENSELNEKVRKEKEYRNALDVGSLPVVVIKNFASKTGKEEVCNALANWAAGLISSRIAHVVVISDNRENAKQLAKALPMKPLVIVALTDADPASSLSYITQRLQAGGVEYQLNPDDKLLIQRLGGRASDLETIIHKVRAGQSVADAVEDIIQRSIVELRKNAFGDDVEDAKGLPWTRQQAWTILKLLAKNEELQYYQLLAEFPFKGDESSLRAMEHVELISIMTIDGRPSKIRPGKPVHRYVFQRLLADKVFQAIQDVAYNELLISRAESAIKAAEAELSTLKDIVSGSWNSNALAYKTNLRARYLANRMYDALKKIERLEAENTGLKKVLAQGDASEVETRKHWWQW